MDFFLRNFISCNKKKEMFYRNNPKTKLNYSFLPKILKKKKYCSYFHFNKLTCFNNVFNFETFCPFETVNLA